MTARNLAFLGLGVMGFPMAGHLASAGHKVTVFNRSPAKAAQWVARFGGRSAPTPEAAAAGADLVLMCVGNDDDVRAVATGPEGALAGMRRGAILVDHTTASATVAREVHAAAAARGIGFLDAPVSGGQAGAENGKLTIMVGGDAATFAAAEATLGHYARAVTLLGGPGAGQLTKMVNQICIAGLLQALAEGVDFAARSGLDVERVLDVIGKGAAQSWQMDNRGRTMLADKFDFGFAVDWMRKDLGICLAEARSNGSALPVTALVDQFYARVQAQGGGRWDTSSLLRALRDPRS
ncbi:MAG: NAD(P)-dependent oxidoreductase [Betaproteobacteria bacterium]|jgi:3-hydroxyisobutyrate dehydrogenase|nr:NAD(P)-dependent oxidoreductase [Betaproteobacteria bacterium]MBK7079936.1 NAD(P)-dependent oxidoreductase [Betaproteobacteria bacterium]MBK7592941.1 NAD(P)-dependent oxidoreductase [Betaproteobacteria bacterium]MBK7743390.1 NAD(P)-dependent oxidoreductase [Betaproteobacteria bacterium]MBK9675804.1 NAD(P)-dependent oxidoreductase [Betaproteobacteria bacterium]